MFAHPQLPSNQNWLIDRMKILIPDTDTNGICYGVAYMGMQAFLAKDLVTFKNRLNLIYQISLQNFGAHVNGLINKRVAIIKEVKEQVGPLSTEEQNNLENDPEAKKLLDNLKYTIDQLINETIISENNRKVEYEKRKELLLNNFYLQKKIEAAKLMLTEKERMALDIPVFLEGIELNQKGYQYKPLFEPNKAPANQKGSSTVQLTMSKSLEDELGIKEVIRITGMYNTFELYEYFSSLSDALAGSKASVAIILSSGSHSIMLGYDSITSVWVLIDANSLPAIENLNPMNLAIFVNKAFSKNSNVTFASEIYIKTSEEHILTPCFSNWINNKAMQNIQVVTPQKVSLADSFSISLLHVAAMAGDLATVERILELNGNTNIVTNALRSPLNIAAQHGHAKILEALLLKGADTSFRDSYGYTPLAMASEKGNLNCVQLLLNAGADPTLANNEGETPLFHAVLIGRLDIVEALLIGIKNFNDAGILNGRTPVNLVEKASNNGVTPLLIALSYGHLKIVTALLNTNVDINKADTNGNTPLLIAVRNGNLDIVIALLDKGASPNGSNKNGVTPLHVAIMNDNLDLVEILLNRGAKTDASTVDGATPLYIATQLGRLDIVETLLKKPCNVNIAFNNNSTPLLKAVFLGRLDIVTALLDKDADPNIETKDGTTPLFAATELGRSDIVQALINKGADVKKAQMKSDAVDAKIKQVFPNASEEVVKLWHKNQEIFFLLKSKLRIPIKNIINYNVDELLKLFAFIQFCQTTVDVNERKLTTDEVLEAIFSTRTNYLDQLLRGNQFSQVSDEKKFEIIRIIHQNNPLEQPLLDFLFSDFMQNNKYEYASKLLNLAGRCSFDDYAMIDEFVRYNSAKDLVNDKAREELFAQADKWITLDDLYEYIQRMRYPTQSKQDLEIILKLADSILQSTQSNQSNPFAKLFSDYPNLNNNQTSCLKRVLDNLTPAAFELLTQIVIRHSHANKPIRKTDIANTLRDAARNLKFEKDKIKSITHIVSPDFPPLFAAIKQGDLLLVRKLLENTDPNFKYKDGVTPLYYAAELGKSDIVQALLAKNADINAARNNGMTPLFIAARKENLETLQILMDNYADPNIERTIDGFTPLFVAIQKKRLDILQKLLSKHAEIYQAIKDGFTPVYTAVDVNHALKDGITPLYAAIVIGNIEIIRTLLDNNANPNQEVDDMSPLFVAIESGRLDIVKTLLDANADPDKKSSGSTPITYAIKFGRLDMVDALLNKNADPNKVQSNNKTPLITAIEYNNVSIIQRLLNEKIDINAKSNTDWTALQTAAYIGQTDVVKMLLDKNADPYISRPNGGTALFYAALCGHTEIAKLILEKINFDVRQHTLKINAQDLRTLAKNHKIHSSFIDQFIHQKNQSQSFFQPEIYVTPEEIADLGGYDEICDLFKPFKTDQKKRKISNDEVFPSAKIGRGDNNF